MMRSSSNATPPRPKRSQAKLESAMLQAGRDFVKKVPVKVDAHIADDWTK
jgi:hypothetical protein